MGGSVQVGGGVLSRTHFFLVGGIGGGELSLVMGGGVATLCGCHGLPGGSSAAATMLCVLCSHESARKVVMTLSIRQPLSHMDGGFL